MRENVVKNPANLSKITFSSQFNFFLVSLRVDKRHEDKNLKPLTLGKKGFGECRSLIRATRGRGDHVPLVPLATRRLLLHGIRIIGLIQRDNYLLVYFLYYYEVGLIPFRLSSCHHLVCHFISCIMHYNVYLARLIPCLT